VPAVDPRDAVAVAEALCRWAATRFEGDVEVVGTPAPIGRGFDSHLHLVRLAGDTLPAAWREPVVVRLLPSVDRVWQAEREATVQGWCAAHGFPAPTVHVVLTPDELFGLPAQVMALAPGVTVLDALKAKPWRARALVDQLATIQLRLHAMDVTGWPGPTDPGELVQQRLSLPRRVATGSDHEVIAEALRRAEDLVPIATGGAPVICHGDFHPLNVMVDGATASVIDWTDAGLGPREADVARTLLLFRVASIAATGPVERAALRAIGPRLARRYRRTYDAGADLDPQRMRAWEGLHALHGWAQVLTLHDGGFDGETSADAARVPVGLQSFLQDRFEAAFG
jgi:aminoglycoside phosphotransferase (APT) family kinase protein